MPPLLLYSTNVALKFLIHEQFRNDLHYVWCSEAFDARSFPPHSIKAHVAPSSNPFNIYKDLSAAVEGNDRHCLKITEQKVSFKNLALEWQASGEISEAEKEDIIYLTDHAPFSDWRPLIYVIPWVLVESRAQVVRPEKRASFGDEYIIPDLRSEEFNIIDLLAK